MQKANHKLSIPKKILVITGYCGWVLLVFYILQYIVAYPMAWILGDNVKKAAWITVYSAIVYTLTLIIVVGVPHLIGIRHKKEQPKSSRNDLGLKDLPTWTDIGLAPVCLIVYLLIATALTNLFANIFPWFNINQAQDLGYSNLLFGFDKIIAMVSLVVIAPIAEEIIFRGFLYQKIKNLCLRKKTNSFMSELPAIIFSSLIVSALFGFLHGQWNVGINVFAMSLVLCAQREITGTIYSGIVLHMIKNAIAFYMIYVLGFGG